jgi:hypothetical protein
MVVVATDEEYILAQERFKGQEIIKTGVGGINIINGLKQVDKNQIIINFGYVGSNIIPIGTEIKVGECKAYHPNVEYKEPTYKLNGDVTCYTSNDFVLQTEIKEPVVFDMELVYILALGFKNVESIKIVSDNLSLKKYEETVKGE